MAPDAATELQPDPDDVPPLRHDIGLPNDPRRLAVRRRRDHVFPAEDPGVGDLVPGVGKELDL